MVLNAQNIIIKLFGDLKTHPLENIIFNALTFFAATTSFVITIKEIVFFISIDGIILTGIPTLLFSTLYFFGRRSNSLSLLAGGFLLVAIGAIVFDWFFVAGITGSVWVVFTAVTTATQMILAGRFLLIANLWLISSFLTIIITSKIYYEKIPGIETLSINIEYYFADIGMICSGIAFIIYIVMQQYRKQHSRMLELNDELVTASLKMEEKNLKLQHALDEIKDLREIIPICASCKSIRNDSGFYESVEQYMQRHNEINFSHTICPDCLKKEHPEIYEKMFPT